MVVYSEIKIYAHDKVTTGTHGIMSI